MKWNCCVNDIIRFALIKFTSIVDHLGLLILVFTGCRYLNVLELPATVVFQCYRGLLKSKGISGMICEGDI